MLTHKTPIGLALFLALCGAYGVAQARKVAPLSARDSKLTTCPLHKTTLRLGTAIILYGRRVDVVPYYASSRQFPQAATHRLGGCVVSSDSPRFQQVKFCPQCRASQARWLKAHNRPLPTR